MVPLSPPAITKRPSGRMSPLCAASSTPKRLMVLRSLRVLVEKIWTRLPLVTAKVSEGEGSAAVAVACCVCELVLVMEEELRSEGRHDDTYDDDEGEEMCVIGLELGDGMSCREENERQYFCSGVLAPGPRGSFNC